MRDLVGEPPCTFSQGAGAGIPRSSASWSRLSGGGSCLRFLSLTADVCAPNNVIQFPVFHFSGKPLSHVCVVRFSVRQKGRSAGGEEEEIHRAGCSWSRIRAPRQLRCVNALGVLNESSRRLQTVLDAAADDSRHPAALMWSHWPEPGAAG